MTHFETNNNTGHTILHIDGGGYYKHAQQYAFFADLLSALSII